MKLQAALLSGIEENYAPQTECSWCLQMFKDWWKWRKGYNIRCANSDINVKKCCGYVLEIHLLEMFSR
jgi:hypothetical protein